MPGQRLGYGQALDALTRVEAAFAASEYGVLPSTAGFLAMTYRKLGRADEAHAALARMRATLAAQPASARGASSGEAAELIEGAVAAPADGGR